MSVSLQAEAIDVAAEYAQLVGDRPGAAVATFTGYVRDHSDERPVATLELEHYPEMAQRVLAELGEEAESRYGLSRWRIVHRFGVLGVSESIVWVGAVADHRGDDGIGGVNPGIGPHHAGRPCQHHQHDHQAGRP